MSLKRITTKEGEVYFIDSKTGKKVEVDAKYTGTNPSSSKERFKTLLGLGQFLSAIGWLIFIAGVISLLVGIISLSARDSSGALLMIGGLVGLINGILVVAVGQIISCFVSIEQNTYEANNLLKSFVIMPNKEDQKVIDEEDKKDSEV